MNMLTKILLPFVFIIAISCTKGPSEDTLKNSVKVKLDNFNSSLFDIENFSRRGSYTYDQDGPNLLLYFKTELKLKLDYKFTNWEKLGASSLISLVGATPAGIKGIKPEGNKAGDILTVYGSNNYIDESGKWVESTIKLITKNSGKKENKFINDIEAQDVLDNNSLPVYQQYIKKIVKLSKSIKDNPENLGVFQKQLQTLLIQGEILADVDKAINGFGTAEENGEYYLFGKAIENILSKKKNKYKSYVTFGSSHNIELVKKGSLKFGIAQGDILKASTDSKLRGIISLFPEAVHVVTLKSSGINSIDDLKTKTINIGPAGSGSNINARSILKEISQVNLIEKDISSGLQQLKSKSIDALIFTGAYPFPKLVKFAGENEIKLLPLKSKSPKSRVQIPGKTYAGQNNAYHTIGTTAVLFTSDKTMDTEISSLLTKLFEHQEQLGQKFTKASSFSKRNWSKGINIPLHNGAKEFFSK
jgi:TRAP transporter TAXI family solute receptor